MNSSLLQIALQNPAQGTIRETLSSRIQEEGLAVQAAERFLSEIILERFLGRPTKHGPAFFSALSTQQNSAPLEVQILLIQAHEF
jgi:hypothetical protein